MFSEFKETAARSEITFAANGYVLYVSGQDQFGVWINRTYVYTNEIDFNAALSELSEVPTGC